MNPRSTLGVNCLLMAVVSFTLVACGGADPQPEPTQQPAKRSVTNQAKPPADTRVKAVKIGSGTAPVELQYEVSARPAPGSSVEVNLYLVGVSDTTPLELSIKPEGKLLVDSGAQASFAGIKTGELLTHTFSVRSPTTGIQVADVQLVTTIGGQPETFEFAIPVAVSPSPSAASSSSK